MKEPTFSIVLPCYSEPQSLNHHWRGYTVQRAIKSIINQQYPLWELIVVDDGCADNFTPRILDLFAVRDPRIKVIHKINENRAIARNTGMDAATGEWICWLDSDDEYASHYLRELAEAMGDFPEYKIFNFGSTGYFSDHKSDVRPTFKPEVEGAGHLWFHSGFIGTGSFIFRRDLWKSKPEYRIPDEVNPYQFAASSKFPMHFEADRPDIENPAGAFQDGVYRHGLSLGNPWGDDLLQFYLLTRDNHSRPLDIQLYIQYVRAHEDRYKYFGQDYNLEIADVW